MADNPTQFYRRSNCQLPYQLHLVIQRQESGFWINERQDSLQLGRKYRRYLRFGFRRAYNMTTQQIGLALELINGYGMSYEDVAHLCSCSPQKLKRLDREHMCFKFKGHKITVQSKINMTESSDKTNNQKK